MGNFFKKGKNREKELFRAKTGLKVNLFVKLVPKNTGLEREKYIKTRK